LSGLSSRIDAQIRKGIHILVAIAVVNLGNDGEDIIRPGNRSTGSAQSSSGSDRISIASHKGYSKAGLDALSET